MKSQSPGARKMAQISIPCTLDDRNLLLYSTSTLRFPQTVVLHTSPALAEVSKGAESKELGGWTQNQNI